MKMPAISDMPRFGVDELLEKPQIDEVVQYVISLSGKQKMPLWRLPGRLCLKKTVRPVTGKKARATAIWVRQTCQMRSGSMVAMLHR